MTGGQGVCPRNSLFRSCCRIARPPLLLNSNQTRRNLQPMDSARVLEILSALAGGRDPATGVTFPPASPYQQADTVRALHAALDALTTTSTNTARSTSSSRTPDPARP